MNVVMIGTGYVGLVSGTCFAEFGADVTCVDVDAAKIDKLRNGVMPIYEPGLANLVANNVAAGRLSFTTDIGPAVAAADLVFIAVGTPSRRGEGFADLTYVYEAARQIAANLDGYTVIVDKSTGPVGTARNVSRIMRETNPGADFDVASNPEFLREGAAISDFMHPDRVVLGVESPRAEKLLRQLYRPLNLRETPILVTNLESAELIKYAANAFLATKISFINEIAAICEKLGADVQEVAVGMGYDKRIGSAFLNAGLGYGGSCFPKDVKALEHMALVHGSHPSLLRAVIDINRDARRWSLLTLRDLLGGRLADRRIGILGLAFKPNTDDLRESPALDISRMLQNEGVLVSAYDPVAMPGASRMNPDLRLAEDPYDLAEGADALLLCTEWNEFKQLDLGKIKAAMAQPVFVDGRNMYEPEKMHELGFQYRAVGRGARYTNGH